MRKVIALTALAIAAVIGVGIAATSVTQSVLAARNVGGATFSDTGGNGGVGQSGSSTANTGAAINTGDWGSGVDQTGGTSNAVGCGHIGGTASSQNNC